MLIFKLTKATLKALNKAKIIIKKEYSQAGNLYLLRIINFNVNTSCQIFSKKRYSPKYIP